MQSPGGRVAAGCRSIRAGVLFSASRATFRARLLTQPIGCHKIATDRLLSVGGVRYRLRPAPMRVAQQFLAALARDWDGSLDALKDHLDRSARGSACGDGRRAHQKGGLMVNVESRRAAAPAIVL